MSARAASAPGAGVLDRLQVLRSAPTPLRGAPAATWTPSPRTGVGPLRVPGPGLQPSSHDTTTTRTDPAGSTLARPDFGPKDGVHLRGGRRVFSRQRARLPSVCFNPRPRTGGDRETKEFMQLAQWVSIRAPARGATRTPRNVSTLDIVSIRAPARGATSKRARRTGSM